MTGETAAIYAGRGTSPRTTSRQEPATTKPGYEVTSS
jgi:hypothetical protein